MDFLLYPQTTGEKGIEVRVQDGTVWLNQAGMAELYGVMRNAVTKHIQNIHVSGEQDMSATCSKMEHVADNGKTYHYLDAFLKFNDAENLRDKGCVTAEVAKAFTVRNGKPGLRDG